MSEWVEWNGRDECPVPQDKMIDVKFANGKLNVYVRAGDFIWSDDIVRDPIVAYRLSEVDEDMVNSPPHYQLLPGVEVYDVRLALLRKIDESTPFDQVSDWDRATEYLMRMWSKNGLEDAKKARWYLDKLIEKLESEK